MLPAHANRPAIIEGRTSQLAFQIGQLVEQMVVDRAIDLAAREVEGEIVVTIDHLRRALDQSVLEDVSAQIGAAFDAAEKAAGSKSAA